MREVDGATPGTRDGEQTKVDVAMLTQATYYLVTGPWPVAHFRSFERITGPKPDRFVVESAGMLFAASGCALAVGASSGGRDRAARVLSVAVPLLSAVVTLRHRPQLRAVYLVDAVTQCGLAVWAAVSRGRSVPRPRSC